MLKFVGLTVERKKFQTNCADIHQVKNMAHSVRNINKILFCWVLAQQISLHRLLWHCVSQQLCI